MFPLVHVQLPELTQRTPGCAVERKAPDRWHCETRVTTWRLLVPRDTLVFLFTSVSPSVSENNNTQLARLELDIRGIELGIIHLKWPVLYIKIKYWESHLA